MVVLIIVNCNLMNREEQIQFNQEIEEYLTEHNVHGTFSQLLQDIMIQKPAQLIDFIIKQLETPQKFTIFVVGPPGVSIPDLIPKALVDHPLNPQLLNLGKQLTAIEQSLSKEDKQLFKSGRLIGNQALKPLVDKIEQCAKSDVSYIIEGFPKNLSQALLLQKRGIYAKNILIVNVHNEGLIELLNNKLGQKNPDLDIFTKGDMVRQAILEREKNINQIKKFYSNYREIDISKSKEEDYIVAELKKAFSLQTIQCTPRVTSQIIIVGAPHSGRTTLGKQIAQHYNLIYISTSILIAEEVRRDTIHGRKIKEAYMNNQLIDIFLMEKLIEERISKKDCKMQGFVLQGYPKSKEQLDNMKNMKLKPTMLVAIDTPKEISEGRSSSSPSKFISRYQNWKTFEGVLRESKEKIFWIQPLLDLSSMYQETIHELEKQFI